MISLYGEVGKHKAPNGVEGRVYTEEQIYEMLNNYFFKKRIKRGLLDFGIRRPETQNFNSNYIPWDDHSLLKNMKMNKIARFTS